jgi:hypothetical protein
MSTVKFIVIVYSHLAASRLDGMLYLEDIHRLSHAPWFSLKHIRAANHRTG